MTRRNVDSAKSLFGDWEAHAMGACGVNCPLCAREVGRGGKRLIPDELTVLGLDQLCETEGCEQVALCQISTGYRFGTYACMTCALKAQGGPQEATGDAAEGSEDAEAV